MAYVTSAYHHLLPARAPTRTPRDRFVVYQRDLHRMASQELDPASLLSGDQYTYAELADAILERVGEQVLPDLDVLVTSYWTPEFDPEFSAFGPYLHHRWKLDCHSFDAIDQGSLSPALALTVLADFLAADETAMDGLLLGVEQSTTPQAFGANLPVPQRSSAGVIRVSQRPDGARAKILASAWIGEQQAIQSDFRLQHLIQAWCDEFDLAADRLTLVLRRDSSMYRRLQYWTDVESASAWSMQYLKPTPSCMHVFEWLSALLAAAPSAGREYIFVDEDVESLAAMALLVRTL
jgi:hypothetical protein